MIFKKKNEVVNPYSIEQCTSCNKIIKRKFKEGDHVFKVIEKCSSCGDNGQMMVVKIFGESVK
jgi:hypothetical protein